MKWMRRLLSLLLACSLAASLITVPASAAEHGGEEHSEVPATEVMTEEKTLEEDSGQEEKTDETLTETEAAAAAAADTETAEENTQAAAQTDAAAPLAETTIVDSGTCGAEGDNLTWTLDSAGTLTISGTGEMGIYSSDSDVPWCEEREAIVTISISNGVTSIGNNAFIGCTSLASVTLPDSVTSIGRSVFDGCTSLSSIIIPDSVTSIGAFAFSGCTSLTDVYISDLEAWCKIVFSGSDSNPMCNAANLYLDGILVCDLVIPDSVTSIGDYVFNGCTSLTSITIPSSVTRIGNYAFDGCTSLASITIPDSVTSIGWYSFYDCTSLASITLPNGVTSINEYTFYNCKNLASITIPDSVTSIGDNAFRGCTSLTSITIPDSVTSIGGSVFRDCTSLASITIPDSVTSIGRSAFEGCTSLASITIPGSVTSIGVAAFARCTSLARITLPDSVTSIGSSAFEDCTSLASITLPDSVTSIGSSAFARCTSLARITLPGSVTSIGSSVFEDCTSLASITLPDSVTSIGSSVFRDCTSLASVTLPDGVTSIGDYAFYGCISLTNVMIPDSVTSIGNYAFSNCASLDDVIIPNNVICMGTWAFAFCTSLTSITIPASVTTIGSEAFKGCTSLTCATISNGNISIGFSLFYNCINLTNVTLPEGLTSISTGMFWNCKSLSSIEIPSSVISVSDFAFANDTGLESVYISDLEAWCNINFNGNISSSNPLSHAGKLYLNGTLVTDLVIPQSVTSINSYVFYGCTSLTDITIPDSVTSIGVAAFARCTSLLSITLPASVTSIGNSAFASCTSLSSITIPGSVTSIGSSVFRDCTSLASVTLPDSVTSIGDYAFDNCTSLADVYYSGSEEAWDAIDIGSYNTELTSATIHYNSTGPEGTGGDTATISGTVYFLSGWDPDTRQVFFDGDTVFPQQLSESADTSGLENLVGRYVLVTTDSGDSSKITEIEAVESYLGTVTDESERSLTIDGTTYPVNYDFLFGTYVDHRVFYHIYEGTIVGVRLLEEQYGILEAWDSDVGTVTVNGTVYPTNYLSDLSDSMEELVGKRVAFSTPQKSTYTPVLELSFPTGFYFITNAVTSSIEKGSTFELYVGYYGEDGNLDPDTTQYISTVSDSGILDATPDGWDERYGQHYTITAKTAGTAVLTVTNPTNGDARSMEFSVIAPVAGYQFTNVPQKIYEAGKVTNFYNYNGMVIDDFAYTPHKDEAGNIDYYEVTMTVYNSLNLYGAVTAFDAAGNPKGFYLIDKRTTTPTGFVSTVQDLFQEIGDLFWLIDNEYYYSGESVTKKTDVSIHVPVGGYLEISNSTSSDTALLANVLGLLIDGVGSVADLGSSGDNLIANRTEIITEIISEEYIEGVLKNVVKKTAINELKHANWNYDNYGECLEVFLDRLSEYGVNLVSELSKQVASVTGLASITESVIMKIIPTGNLINFLYDVLGMTDQVDAWVTFQKSMDFSDGICIYAPTAGEGFVSNGISVEIPSESTTEDVIVHAYLVVDSDEVNITSDTFPYEQTYLNGTYETYNITMYKDGQETQPGGPVTVRIPLSDEFSALAKDKIKVYRINEDGTATDMSATISDGYAVFTTDHFSYYALAYEGEQNAVISGTLSSWDQTAEAAYLLYDGSLTDAEIRADLALDVPELALAAGTGGTVLAGETGAYEQSFTFNGVAAGNYKLVICKDSRYVPHIVACTVGEAGLDVGTICVQLIGDINGDGQVTFLDAAEVNAYVRGTGALDDYAYACAEVNGDHSVTFLDAAQINAHARGGASLWE